MNTTVKTIALALGLGIAQLSQAQEPAVTIIDQGSYIAKMIPVANTNTMKVYVGNIESQKLSFMLKDVSGTVLYSRNISKNEPQAYIRLNMEELPDGVYHVELGDKDGKSVKAFKKGSDYIAAKTIGTLVALN